MKTASTLIFCLALVLSMQSAICAVTHHGKGTAYSKAHKMDATGQNMCEYSNSQLADRWEVYYAAMNEDDWDAMGGKDGVCGRCISVRGVKGQTTGGAGDESIIVKIVDQCPSSSCEKGSVDFSTNALKAITGYGWDKKSITWQYVDCPSGSARSGSRKASSKPSKKSSSRKGGRKAAML